MDICPLQQGDWNFLDSALLCKLPLFTLEYFYEIRMSFPESASKTLSHKQSTAKYIFFLYRIPSPFLCFFSSPRKKKSSKTAFFFIKMKKWIFLPFSDRKWNFLLKLNFKNLIVIFRGCRGCRGYNLEHSNVKGTQYRTKESPI